MATRFLELNERFAILKKNELILMTSKKMAWPIIYTVLTTICAFLSLIFSEIKPIIDFGWMMTFGLITSFLITFTLLPTLLNFVKNSNVSLAKDKKSKITSFFGNKSISYNHISIGKELSFILNVDVGDKINIIGGRFQYKW